MANAIEILEKGGYEVSPGGTMPCDICREYSNCSLISAGGDKQSYAVCKECRKKHSPPSVELPKIELAPKNKYEKFKRCMECGASGEKLYIFCGPGPWDRLVNMISLEEARVYCERCKGRGINRNYGMPVDEYLKRKLSKRDITQGNQR